MYLSSLLVSAAALTSLAFAAPSTHSSTTVTFRVPASAQLANPFSLPPSTHATLTSAGQLTLSAPLSTANAFVFHNVTPGSYLVDIHAPTHAFAPLRLDVLTETDGDGHGATPADGKGRGVILRAWETYRGNDWDNKGEAVALAEGDVFDVRALGVKNYYAERSGCE
jgi:ER membrane protein complex subunit 7